MGYYIGVDGGGTKTEFALSKADGKPVYSIIRSGCSYQSLGVIAAVDFVKRGIYELLAAAGVTMEECVGCCVGMPCYGENPELDKVMASRLRSGIIPIPVYMVNDVEVGWAGSMECREGIHVVSGTGSIAYGQGKDGQSARCGGWNEFFGDEGSGYWIGRKAMELFSKESDGRVKRGALYDIVRREFALVNDFYFVDVIKERLAPYRAEVAAFQHYNLEAARAGDEAAAELYRLAAAELALMVKGVMRKLTFTDDVVSVSYSGGMFKTGDLMVKPFQKEVEAMGCRLVTPLHGATEGALILGIKHFGVKGTVKNDVYL